jgi:large subunit ribosomal protein L4e
MKLQILTTDKSATGNVTLPKQFDEPVREDLIKRAVHALQAAARQAYGADPEAGKRSSAELSRRRRKYRGSYGKGISRVPRKILTRRGTQMYMVGAFAPGTVGGRRAHAPKAEKSWEQKVNTRENRKAIRSALAAVMDKEIVTARGHKVPDSYPFVLDNSFQELEKTAAVKKALLALDLTAELARAEPTTVRAGKGKMRGRKTKRATSLLIVTGIEECKLELSAANIPGVDVVPVNALNAELLAPGTHAGRATLFTQQALVDLEKEKLFLDAGKKRQAAKKVETKDVKEAAKKTTKPAAKETKAADKPTPKEEKVKPAKKDGSVKAVSRAQTPDTKGEAA